MQVTKIMGVLSLLVLLSMITLSSTQVTKTLIYVQQVFRHGHRYLIYPSKNDNSTYVNQIHSNGELTKQGKSMHYILGQQLYKRYWQKLFGGTPYVSTYNQSKFYVKSTNVNRTIESVQSQLAGIFQNMDPLMIEQGDVQYSIPQWPDVTRDPGNVYSKLEFFQSIPIHVEKGYLSPWDKGDFLRTYSSQFCPNQDKWMDQNKKNKQILAILEDPKFVAALQKVRNVLKVNITNWDLYKYYDNAVCMIYERRKEVNPIWTTQDQTKKALDVMFVLDMYMKLYYQEQQLSATSTGYFNETYYNFKKITKDTSGVQWAFYSAHDTTVGNFLARMNLTNVDCIYQNYKQGKTKNTDSDTCILQYPWYTTTLIFEVYKNQEKGKDTYYTFKVMYNGLQRKIPFCDWKTECPIEVYYNWFNTWKDDKYVEACGVVNELKDDVSTYFSIAVLEFGVILCVLIYALYGYLNNKDQQNVVVSQKKAQQSEQKNEQIRARLSESLISEEQE